MSTLKVTNIQDTGGSNSSTSAEIYSGRAKAWVNFDGTGTVAIRASFNVSSITDNGTGIYTVNFSSSLPDSSYAFSGGVRYNTGDGRGNMFVAAWNDGAYYASSSLRINTCNDGGGQYDAVVVNVSIFR